MSNDQFFGPPNAYIGSEWLEHLDRLEAQGQPNPAILKLAFWEAMKRCGDDDRIHDMAYPYHDDPKIDGDVPAELWEHMATAIQELSSAAGRS